MKPHAKKSRALEQWTTPGLISGAAWNSYGHPVFLVVAVKKTSLVA
jgi:hypothetical protein